MSSLRVPPPKDEIRTSITLSTNSVLSYNKEFAALLLKEM